MPHLSYRNLTRDHFGKTPDVFDQEYFMHYLASNVKIINKLPKELAIATKAVKYFVSWSGVKYYQNEISRLWDHFQFIRAAKADSCLANCNLPPDIQKLHCRAFYEAFQFAPHIEALGKLLVERMRSYGPYIGLQFCYEKDMLAFSGCTHGLSSDKANALTKIRKNYYRVDELEPFGHHASQMAALDYSVSVGRDVFVPCYSGYMVRAVEDYRRFLATEKQSLLIDKSPLVNGKSLLLEPRAKKGSDMKKHFMRVPYRIVFVKGKLKNGAYLLWTFR